MPIFCCCVSLPLKNKNPEKYKVCDRVITVNDCAAHMMEKWMPRTIGFFRHSKEAYDYLKEAEGENYEE